MAREFKATLSNKSIENLINQLKEYRNSLDDKTQIFLNRLLEVGVVAAESVPGISGTLGSHGFEDRVYYYKKVDNTRYGCHGVLVGMGETINVKWGANNEKSGSINTMLALEFGTASKAVPAGKRLGVTFGKGTNSNYGYADADVWYFIQGTDNKGSLIWKKASAITPTRPMLKASDEMISQIRSIAKEVFGK